MSFIRQKDSADNAWAAAANLLRAMGLAIPAKAVKEELTSHPAYPGLTALMDGLEEFGVKAKALGGRVDQLPDIRYPNIAHLNRKGGGHFVVLTGVDAAARRVTWLDPEEGPGEDSWENFDKAWTGKILLAEAPPLPARRRLHSDESRVPGVALWPAAIALVLGAGVLSMPLLSAMPSHQIAWLLLKSIGAGLSIALALHAVGPFRRLCPAGATINCESVLNSPGAKILGRLPMADVGVAYFLWGIIGIVASAAHPDPVAREGIGSLALAGLIAPAYSVFSTAYQGIVIRKWCPLCLAVQGVLIMEGALILGFETGSLFNYAGPGLPALSATIAAASLWMILRPLILAHFEIDSHRRQARRLQDDPALIEAALARAVEAPDFKDGGEISVGNPGAPFELVAVTHPRCRHCAGAHEEIREKMTPFLDILKIHYRFMIDEKDIRARSLALTALGLWSRGRKAEAIEALDRVFGPTGSAGSPDASADEPAGALLDAQARWARAAGCEGTPSFFLNGRKLPADATLKGLRMFLRKFRRARPARPDRVNRPASPALA